ncbi:carboxypeptidase regulatory-like domain-containing protein [Paenibacillus sedimenti]|uniref:Carboxypeptidase regulatory-like domain-containing protein n=1 Tax=Paenibacillus sedimenti TaxID=2770274 RepID=A0A926QL62_9BACL|nr:carboxypeptidase regulatory-like domain-containing protein [Paenibacillus sedimenti]MBD0382119.1 carboxypeptidase regulatory-like domain-containing protein [Paenibacillus sedimenti]
MKPHKFRLFAILLSAILLLSPWTLVKEVSADELPGFRIFSPISTLITHDMKPDIFLYAPEGATVRIYEANEEENELIGKAIGAGDTLARVQFDGPLSKGVHSLIAELPDFGSINLPLIIIDPSDSFDIRDVAEYSFDPMMDSWDFTDSEETEVGNLRLSNLNFLLHSIEPKSNKQKFIIGQVTDRETQEPVSDAEVKFRVGDNIRLGEVAAKTVTNSNGMYKVDLIEDTYTMEINRKGYAPAFITKVLVPGEDANVANKLEIAPIPEIGDIRIELSWGAQPRDLDSHLIGAKPDRKPFHVYYGNDTYEYKDLQYAHLDEDITHGGGLEKTILSTVSQQVYGPYKFYVNNYSGDANLAGAGVTVNVYKENSSGFAQILGPIVVPNTGNNEPYWHVFDLTFEAGVPNFVVKNELTNEEPIYMPEVESPAGGRLLQAAITGGSVDNNVVTLVLDNSIAELLTIEDFEVTATMAGVAYKVTGLEYSYVKIGDVYVPEIRFAPMPGDTFDIHIAPARNSQYLEGSPTLTIEVR